MRAPLYVASLLACSSLQAWDCEYEKKIDLVLDLADSRQLTVLAAAGDLEISGTGDLSAATIKGRACVSEKEWLEDARVELNGGRDAEISVRLPEDASGWSFLGNRYAYIDLRLQVPDGLPLVVNDSSGDLEIEGVGALELKDSSGDIDVENSAGPVTIQDSSGDIYLADISGDVTVRSDSSGDIEGRDIGGSLRVESDSSGDIDFSHVNGDFIVERDSSGDIIADTVNGDFRVLRDGSGEIRSKNVRGEVEVPGA
jgi:DUF4097 and DUF4098 domain-containing protein YvlB